MWTKIHNYESFSYFCIVQLILYSCRYCSISLYTIQFYTLNLMISEQFRTSFLLEYFDYVTLLVNFCLRKNILKIQFIVFIQGCCSTIVRPLRAVKNFALYLSFIIALFKIRNQVSSIYVYIHVTLHQYMILHLNCLSMQCFNLLLVSLRGLFEKHNVIRYNIMKSKGNLLNRLHVLKF